MTLITKFAPGMPAWVDLMTDDRDAAAQFYGQLFGWTFDDASSDETNYVMAFKEGQPVAGIGEKPADTPFQSIWTTYIAVRNAEATSVAIAAAGGLLSMNPIDVSDGERIYGRMAIAADPAGAMFGIWEPATHHGSGRIDEHGSLTWNESMSRDANSARAFYSAVFGWKLEQIGDGVSFDYTIAQIGQSTVAGIMQMPNATPETASYWMTYFASDDPDTSVQIARELGASIISEPSDSPYGRFAIIQDPQGSVFSVIQTPPEP